jgi:hypothetical protein
VQKLPPPDAIIGPVNKTVRYHPAGHIAAGYPRRSRNGEGRDPARESHRPKAITTSRVADARDDSGFASVGVEPEKRGRMLPVHSTLIPGQHGGVLPVGPRSRSALDSLARLAAHLCAPSGRIHRRRPREMGHEPNYRGARRAADAGLPHCLAVVIKRLSIVSHRPSTEGG